MISEKPLVLIKRLPSLDGLRAVSISLVLFSHCVIAQNFPEQLKEIARHGSVGVTIFFVISGFLITNLLLAEESKTKKIDLKNFYIRRIFRILPVFLLYTCFIIIWMNFETLGVTHNNLVHAFTFTVNFDMHRNWFIGHFWSLSVEEQFYLLLPLILVFVRKKAKLIVLLLILFSCLSRVFSYKFPGAANYVLFPFFDYSDAIFVGVIGGMCYYEDPALINHKAFSVRAFKVMAVLLIVFFTYTTAHGKFALISLPLGNTIISFSILFLILSYMLPTNKFVFNFLNHPVLVHIGILSYSIYIWQQFFFTGTCHFFWRSFPINLLFIYLTALASYNLWERPFLNLRKYLIK